MKKSLALITVLVASLLCYKAEAASAKIGPCQETQCVEYFNKFKKYARIGYTDAMVTLAEMHYYGYGTKRSLKNALKHYKSAAKYGSVKGQFKTAMMYFNHEEFADLDKGIKYLKKAARNNSVDSSFLLGIMYFDANFYEQDFDEADKWLTKAYTKGYNKMPAYIELMKKSGDFTQTNFPDLMDAMKDNPIVITQDTSTQEEMAEKEPAPLEEREATIKTAQASISADKQESVVAPKSEVEVITVYNDLPKVLDAQLITFKYSLPEKGAQNTGSRIIGKTCEKTMSCAPTSNEDFKRGVRLVLGDHAVATFSESFRGYSGF